MDFTLSPQDIVAESLRVITAGQAASGAYVASPNFPEYSFGWLRDGSYCALAMDAAGRRESAASFHDWAARVIVGQGDRIGEIIDRLTRGDVPAGREMLPTRYTLDGEPERVDEDAWPNFQLDGYGTWLFALHSHLGCDLPEEFRPAVELTADYLAAAWQMPCFDYWEESGDLQHTSTLGAIAAGLVAASRMLRRPDLDELAQTVLAYIFASCTSAGSFGKGPSDARVDASLISLATPFGLVDPGHPVMLATIERIRAELSSPSGGIRRYLGDTYYGGNPWLLLTAWLGWHDRLTGRETDHSAARNWIQGNMSVGGGLAEQVLDEPQDLASVQPWIDRWGPVADPLLWSHAKFILMESGARRDPGLIPDRAHYAPGRPVVVEFAAVLEHDTELVVSRLQEVCLTVTVPAGVRSAALGVFEPGGYGVNMGLASTAFDVLASPFERPRYGFVARLGAAVDIDAVSRNFRRLHLNLAQLYDWAYRHSELMPPAERYVDPLGQERDLSVVNEVCRRLDAAGTVPLGYSAVYAIGSDELSDWTDSVMLRASGEPYRLGDNFLVLVDPSEPVWLEHYLAQLERVVAETSIRGFHLDQYGWPKFAVRADGTHIDLAEAFPVLLAAVRDRLPDTPFMFNNVNDFPTYATAGSPQDATYIEVWEPHSELQDLATLAGRALALRPEHPPILSAYLSCYAAGEARANNAAALVMATAFSHGASHLLLGEDGSALSGPYYPDNHGLSPSSLDFFARWYDFQVRYGDLFYDPAQVDVTEFFTGGINDDVSFTGPEGTVFSTKAVPGTVWTRVVRTSLGIVVHLVNLVGQTVPEWDAGKNDPVVQRGVTLKLAMVGADATVWAVDVDEPAAAMRRLSVSGSDVAAQVNALSAGQDSVSFALPDVGAWTVVFIPAAELG